MSFQVSDDCIKLGLRAGAIVFHNVWIGPSSPAVQAEIANEAEVVRSRFSSSSEIRSNPFVSSFQRIIRQVGGNPRTERCSLESLLNFALKRGELPSINNLVDAYNLVSIRFSCSLGAHDLDRIALPVSLRLLDGTESFTPLGSNQPIPTTAGEFGYVDASNRLLCRLDVRQAEFSKVTEATKNVLLIVEGTADHSVQVLRQTFADVMEIVIRFCGGTGEIISFPE